MDNSLLEPNKDILERIVHFVVTDIGSKRESNQDNFIVINGENFKLFVVCDGMGGTDGGEIASQMTVSYLESKLSGQKIIDIEDVKCAAFEANELVFNYGMEHKEVQGLGTTITSLLVMQKGSWLLNVGDSRVYKFFGNNIEQITQDDTVLNELIKSGVISPEKAKSHPVANMLTKTIGQGKSLEIETTRLGFLDYNDKYLLCSDGLYNMLSNDEMVSILKNPNPREAVKGLIDKANKNGGVDNITAMLVGTFKKELMDSEKKEKKVTVKAANSHEISTKIDLNKLNKKIEDIKKDATNYIQNEVSNNKANKVKKKEKVKKNKQDLTNDDIRILTKIILFGLLAVLIVIFCFPFIRTKENKVKVPTRLVENIGGLEVKENDYKFTFDYRTSDNDSKLNDILNYKQKEKDAYNSILEIIDSRENVDETKLKDKKDDILKLNQKIESEISKLNNKKKKYIDYNNQNLIETANKFSSKDKNVKDAVDDFYNFSFNILNQNFTQKEYNRLQQEKLDKIYDVTKAYVLSKIKSLENSVNKKQNDLMLNQFELSIIDLKLEYAKLLSLGDEDKINEFKVKINLMKEREE